MRKTIKGFERYEVDEEGHVYSLISGRELKGSSDPRGYRLVELFYERGKSKQCLVHRLVATAFIPNEKGLPIINHKDENPSNNRVDNLEWCTYKYNVNYGNCQKKIRESKARSGYYKSEDLKEMARRNGAVTSKPVLQLTRQGELVAAYPSGAAAARATGLDHPHILECCNGRRYKTVGGYVWKFGRSEDLLVSQF